MGRLNSPIAGYIATLFLVCLCHEVSSARILLQKETEDAGPGFLSREIPLTVMRAIPEKLLTGGSISVGEKQSITVVLSRPVLALGEDLGSDLPPEYTPFFLQPPVEGTYRWLSTYIVTFEPKKAWAADLEVDFQWNLQLTTYDGVPFTPGVSANTLLRTPTLNLTVVNVVSNETNYLTDNNWDAFVGTQSDILPEVPNDAYIELRASSDMKLGALQNFIRIQDDLRNTPVEVQLSVTECSSLPELPCIDCASEEEEEEPETETTSVYLDYPESGDQNVDDYSTPEVEVITAPATEGVISDCANISFIGEEGFISGRKYAMILPSDTNYSNDAGSLKRDIRITFGGLREFRIPFVEQRGFNVSSPVLDMWIPHGLDPEVNMTKFPFRIVRSTTGADIEFSLEKISKSIIRVTAALIPGVTYKATGFDSTTIFDGYGQKMRRSSLNFVAAPIAPLLKAMDVGTSVPFAIFEEGQDWGRKIVAFAKGSALSDDAICEKIGSDVSLWDIDRTIEVLPLFSYGTHTKSVSEYLGLSSDLLVVDRKDLAGEMPEQEIDGLLKTSGIVAAQYCRNDVFHPLVIAESSLQVVVISTGAAAPKGARIALVWVTDMTTAEPVSGAAVTIYSKTGKPTVIDNDYKLATSAKTDKNGLGEVTLQAHTSELHALVELDGKNIYVPHVEASASISMDITDSIILDRRLVKPGETLHVKGYVMENKAGSLVASSLKNYRLVVSPSMSSSKRGQDLFELEEYDKDFGTYTHTIRIPTSVPVVPYTIRVEADLNGDTYVGRPHSFTIADPRQPPVTLTVDAPHWAQPKKNLKLSTQAKSFVGAAVENAQLAYVWSIEDSTRDPEDESLSGRITATTDEDGVATATIPLAKFTNPPSAGTILQVHVQYNSPSGDFVEEVLKVRLEPADVDIKLERTIETDVPGLEFGVKATVTDLLGEPLDKKLKINSVTLHLKEFEAVSRRGVPTPRPTTADRSLPGKSLDKCTLSVPGDKYCTFEIPKMKFYVVESCVSIGKNKVCKRIYVGKTQEQWKAAPLSHHLPLSIKATTEGPYRTGDDVEFLIENPYENVNMLVAWGTTEEVSTMIVPAETGRSTFKLKVDSVCTNNCAVSIVASIPRQKKGIASKLDVPVNSLFDPATPHTEHYSTVIETERDTSLGIKISVPEVEKKNGLPLIEPGLNASVRVDFDRKGPTEITVIAVDKAVLDLLPYPLKDASKDFVADLANYFKFKSSSDYVIAPGAIDAVVKANEARKGLDPWFRMLTRLRPSDEDADINLSDEDYLEKYVQYLTVKPRDQHEGSVSHPMATTSESAEDKPSSEDDQGQSVGVQAQYVPTSLFKSYTASGGEWLVNFEGPAQGGEFIIRAYASSGTGLFGSDEVTVSVRKAISLAPDFPAFARLGDEFEAGIVISTSSVLKEPLTVTIETEDVLSFSGPDILKVNMNKQLEKELRFNFVAEGIGQSQITIVADDGFGNSATAKISFQVHGPQTSVVIGSAFTVSGLANSEPMTKMDIPNALAGSGSIVVSAGTGQQPGILLLADQVRSEGSFSCPVNADFALGVVATTAILDAYEPWSPDPNLLPEFMVNLINNAVTDYDQGQYHLSTLMTSRTNGLETNYACPGSGFANPSGVSLEQNAKGIFIINEIQKALKGHAIDTVETNNAGLLAARDLWIEVLEEAFVAEAVEAKDTKAGSISTAKVAMVRLALGPGWNPPKGTDSEVAADISMDRLKRGFNTMSLESQAYYVLALLSVSKPNKAEVNKAINAWKDLIFTSGNRAYVVSEKKSVTPASNLANGLILLAMSRAGEKGSTLERMATYVTAPVSDIYGFTTFTTYEKIVSMLALAEYDPTAKDKKANVRLEVKTGTNILLQHVFLPERRPAAVDSTDWEDLDKDPAPIEVVGLGSGEINVAIALKFVPRDLLQYPVYKGIFVDRTIQLDSAGAIGEGLETVPIGTVVNVKVQFMTPRDLEHTTVSVAMPAGLEPVQIGGEGTEYCPVPFFNLFDEDYYPSCPEQSTRADSVRFMYESVSAGAHTVSFKAVAVLPGSFGLPATKVYATNSPEIMGLSSAGRFDICKPGKKCTVDTVKKTFVAKQCDDNCNGNGVCDLNSGDCLCFVGFRGGDCAKAAV